MTLPATNLRFNYITVGFITECSHLHAALKHGGDGTHHSQFQLHELARISPCNLRHRACLAQVGRP